jgi:hypothetical protein
VAFTKCERLEELAFVQNFSLLLSIHWTVTTRFLASLAQAASNSSGHEHPEVMWRAPWCTPEFWTLIRSTHLKKGLTVCILNYQSFISWVPYTEYCLLNTGFLRSTALMYLSAAALFSCCRAFIRMTINLITNFVYHLHLVSRKYFSILVTSAALVQFIIFL